jgi:uncharacterized protein
MSLSMYQASVPLFLQTLGCEAAILGKAAAYAEAKKIDPSVLLNARLFPDMFPLSRQVQIACDFAKGATARLAGAEVPSYADTEATIPELQQRIAKTIAFVSQFKPEQIDGSEQRDISLKVGGQDMAFKGQHYLVHFVLPNFLFHATTAYAILRHSGVELGKRDFMMPPGA